MTLVDTERQPILSGLAEPVGIGILIAVFGAIPYGIDLIGGPRLDTHGDVVHPFRPGEPRPIAGSHAAPKTGGGR